MTKIRAPGKMMLSGEWSVLEGAPCLVLAIDRGVTAKISEDFMKLSAGAKNKSGDQELDKQVDKTFRKILEFNKELSKEIHQVLDGLELFASKIVRVTTGPKIFKA